MKLRGGPNLIDLTGRRFGLLKVLGDSGKRTPRGAVLWEVKCKCGVKKLVWGVSLRAGLAQSCGCKARMTHGHCRGGKRSGTYNSWRCAVRRCTDPTNQDYASYGGRGITVPARWLGKKGFVNFLADMGERPAGTTLDRKDNERGYSKSNCTWSTPAAQAINRRPRSVDDDVAADAGFGS
jgi:hypothetical protein